jgi:hypothetical protein
MVINWARHADSDAYSHAGRGGRCRRERETAGQRGAGDQFGNGVHDILPFDNFRLRISGKAFRLMSPSWIEGMNVLGTVRSCAINWRMPKACLLNEFDYGVNARQNGTKTRQMQAMPPI